MDVIITHANYSFHSPVFSKLHIFLVLDVLPTGYVVFLSYFIFVLFMSTKDYHLLFLPHSYVISPLREWNIKQEMLF